MNTINTKDDRFALSIGMSIYIILSKLNRKYHSRRAVRLIMTNLMKTIDNIKTTHPKTFFASAKAVETAIKQVFSEVDGKTNVIPFVASLYFSEREAMNKVFKLDEEWFDKLYEAALMQENFNDLPSMVLADAVKTRISSLLENIAL